MVSAYGAGLEGGSTGERGTPSAAVALSSSQVLTSTQTPGSACEFLVNTSKAGPGALAVTIDGPSKVKMDCVEVPEGYRVTYTPMAPGSYLISIKYGGPYHIVGSPFKARISGESTGAPRRRQEHDLRTALSSRLKARVQPQRARDVLGHSGPGDARHQLLSAGSFQPIRRQQGAG